MKLFLFFLCFVGAAQSLSAESDAWTVVIDPGHGGVLKMGVNDGSDSSHGASHNNATGKTPGGTVLEKTLTLAYSKAIAAEIKKLPDARAVLTRDADVSISAMGRAATAVEHQADVFLSIHFNGGGGSGTRAYVVAEDHEKWEYMHFTNPYIKRDSALGLKLVQALDKTYTPYGGEPSATKVFNDSKFPSDANGLGLGNLKDGIRTLGYTRMDPHLHNTAVVLLEVEFLDNPATAEWLVKEKVRQETAKAIAAALQEWRTSGAKEFLVPAPVKSPGR